MIGNTASSSAPISLSRRQLLILTLAVEGGMLVLAAGLGWLVGPSLWAMTTLDARAILSGVLVGLALFVVAAIAVDSPLGRDTQLRRDMDRLAGLFHEARPIDLLLISVLAGVGEEALFRGFLLQHGSAWLGVPLGVALTSLLFGLMHAVSLDYIIFATLIGAAMSGLYLWSGNLALPMATHAAYDFAALVYMIFLRRTTSEASP